MLCLKWRHGGDCRGGITEYGENGPKARWLWPPPGGAVTEAAAEHGGCDSCCLVDDSHFPEFPIVGEGRREGAPQGPWDWLPRQDHMILTAVVG